MVSYAFGTSNSHADARSLLAERGLGRTKATLLTWVATVIACYIVFAIGAVAGLNYGLADDKVWTSMGVGVPFVTTTMLIPGMALASLLSLKWSRILDLARIVGPALALLTIVLSFLPDMSLASSIALGLMHVVAVPILIFGIDLIKRRDAWTRR